MSFFKQWLQPVLRFGTWLPQGNTWLRDTQPLSGICTLGTSLKLKFLLHFYFVSGLSNFMAINNTYS